MDVDFKIEYSCGWLKSPIISDGGYNWASASIGSYHYY